MIYYHNKNYIGNTVLQFVTGKEIGEFYRLVMDRADKIYCETSIFNNNEQPYADMLRHSIIQKFARCGYVLKVTDEVKNFFRTRNSAVQILPDPYYFDYAFFVDKNDHGFWGIELHLAGGHYMERKLYEDFLPVLKAKKQPEKYQEIVSNLRLIRKRGINAFRKLYKAINYNLGMDGFAHFYFDSERQKLSFKSDNEKIREFIFKYPIMLEVCSSQFKAEFEQGSENITDSFYEEYFLISYAYGVDLYEDMLKIADFNYIAELGYDGKHIWTQIEFMKQQIKESEKSDLLLS